MQANGIITLTTDFGTHDPYAGIMKGVIYAANNNAHLVDITHHIPAHDITSAAFTLANSCCHFPDGTVHVAVVDPGVGGERKNIAVRTDRYFYVGPDNGIFSIVLEKEKVKSIREIANPPFILNTVSQTFHGRDVFAPCAGRISGGGRFADIGPALNDYNRIEYPLTKQSGNTLIGEIMSIDSFGNLISNISKDMFRDFTHGGPFEIYFSSERFNRIASHYAEAQVGSTLVLFGSSGYLEISINGKSASSYFMASSGSTITVRRG